MMDPSKYETDAARVTRYAARARNLEAELARYKQALTRANGFLIMHGREPVKLEYAADTEGKSDG